MTIFRQWRQVLDGTKTATNRIRATYKVGSVQPVIPKYRAPSVWWKPDTGEIVENPRHFLDSRINASTPIERVNGMMRSIGYVRAQVRFTSVRPMCVQDMTKEDCIHEGIVYSKNADVYYCPRLTTDKGLRLFDTAQECYAALWNSINQSPKRLRWEANPHVFHYRFELVKP